MATRKAKKVEQLHVECGACGALNAVDRKTGDVITYGRGAAKPAPDDPDETGGSKPPEDPPPSVDDGDADDDDGFLSNW